jgi:hypothetical protein
VVGESGLTPARILNTLALVGTALAVSYFAIDALAGFLRVSEVGVQVQRGVLFVFGTSLGLGQWPITVALARRLRAEPLEHPLATGCSYFASGVLLVFVALLVR